MTYRPLTAVVAASLAVVLATCGETGGPLDQGVVNVPIALDVSRISTVSEVVVEVTGPGIDPPLVFNLALSGGQASGTITIPAGADRTITVRVYDDAGIETHRGAVTVDIQEGSNPSLTFTLLPLTGDVPIDVRIGAITVTVTPATATVIIGETLSLTATVVDTAGDTLAVKVTWATLNPALATVDAAGVVTARAAGQVDIVATYAGVGSTATLTLAYGPALFDHIAFTTFGGGLVVMQSDGSNPVSLNLGIIPAWYPAWSPDATQIAFQASGDVYVIGTAGTNQRRLTYNAGVEVMSWSPDGSHIAYASFTGPSQSETWGDIYVMNADGSDPVNLTAGPARGFDPAWSPDGSHIAYVGLDDAGENIYVMQTDGSDPVRLTYLPEQFAHLLEPAWSPDGTRIAFVRPWAHLSRIWVMDSDGSNVFKLTPDPSNDEGRPTWSPDGTAIAYDRWTGERYEIFRAGLDGSSPVSLGPGMLPAWSPRE